MIIYNQGTENPDYLTVQNSLAELSLDTDSLKESFETTLETTQQQIVSLHS